MIEKTIAISGMSCQHCVMAVRSELAKLPGVDIRELVPGSATLRYDETQVGSADIARAIHTAGYEAKL